MRSTAASACHVSRTITHELTKADVHLYFYVSILKLKMFIILSLMELVFMAFKNHGQTLRTRKKNSCTHARAYTRTAGFLIKMIASAGYIYN